MNIVTIEQLEKQIDFWNDKLKKSRNQIECAELSDKIAHNRKRITELSLSIDKKEVKSIIDAPVIADNLESTQLVRGQVIDTSNNDYRMFL